jgi:hypothetical protein
VAPAEQQYTRLPGQFRGFLRRHSLWIGSDHLLQVDSTRFSENYKRFYLRDIQSIIVRKTPRGRIPYYWILLAAAAFLTGVLGLENSRPYLFVPAFLLLAAVLVYLYIAGMFQSCTCHLVTRVTNAELPSLFRLHAAGEFIDIVGPRITSVQGELPAGWVERSASLEESATAADQNPAAPVDLLPAAQFSWINVLVFLLVLVDGAIAWMQLRSNDAGVMSTFNTLNLIALAVAASFSIVRLTRQKASRTLRSLVLGGLLVVAAVMYGSIMLQSFDQQIYHQTYKNALLYPGMRQLAFFEIFADAAIALPGMVLAFRLKESRP